jgi:hypothetical protein
MEQTDGEALTAIYAPRETLKWSFPHYRYGVMTERRSWNLVLNYIKYPVCRVPGHGVFP